MSNLTKRVLFTLGMVAAVAFVIFCQWAAYAQGAQALGQEPNILAFLGLVL